MRVLRLVFSLALCAALLVPTSAFAAGIEALSFTSSTTGYMSGGYYDSDSSRVGFVSRTTDGGQTWAAESMPGRWFYGLDARGANVWAVSSFWPYAWKSGDSGVSFTSSTELGPGGNDWVTNDVALTGTTTAVVVGRRENHSEYYGSPGAIWRTPDGGATWEQTFLGPLYEPTEVWATDPVTGERYIKDIVPNPTQAHLLSADVAPGTSTVYVVGYEDEQTDRALAYKTTNGGSSFTTMTVPAEIKNLRAVSAATATEAWAVGGSGTDTLKVLKSTNGSSFSAVTLPTTMNTWYRYAIDARVGSNGTTRVAVAGAIPVVPAQGKVGISIDGGATWKEWAFPTGTAKVRMNAIVWLDDTHLIVAGDSQWLARLTIDSTGAVVAANTVITQAVEGNVGATPDTAKPVTTHTGVPAGWTKSDVTFTLSASDAGGSGVANTYYTLNGGPQQTYTAPVKVSAAGTTQLQYWSVDGAGNVESAKGPFAIKIDKTAPVTGDSVTPTYQDSATISLSPSDSGGSGLKATKWRLVGETDWTLGTSVSTSVTGVHTLEFYSEDNAGNVEATKSEQFTVNGGVAAHATALTLSAPSTSDYKNVRIAGRLTDTVTATTLGNRPVTIEYSFDGSSWNTLTSVVTWKQDSKGWLYEYYDKPSKKTYYRAKYAGESGLTLSQSAPDSVLPKVKLTRSTSWTTLSLNRTYYAKGTIEPGHSLAAGDNKVTVRAYKKGSDGAYHYVKSFSTTYSSYSTAKSTYSAAIKFTKSSSRGTWKFVARHYKDAKNYTTYGSADYVKVK